MKRREMIAGAVTVAILVTADKALPQPVAAPADAAKPDVIEATVEAIYQAPILVEGKVQGANLVVMLKARGQERYLPVWIGVPESYNIAFGLAKTQTLRPMSHDVMAALVAALHGTVEAVYVALGPDTKTYLATIKVVGQGIDAEVDCRPSDGLALALRAEAPIFVATGLMKRTTLSQMKHDLELTELGFTPK